MSLSFVRCGVQEVGLVMGLGRHGGLWTAAL